MGSKYLEMSPPVAAALKAGTPIVAIETGFFMKLPYPRCMEALEDCEQAFWRRDCVPCCVAVINGKLKAGLNKNEMELLCGTGGIASRRDIPALVADRLTTGLNASGAMAVAHMAGIVPVMAPGLTDAVSDLDALEKTATIVFCRSVYQDKSLLFGTHGIPVLDRDSSALSDAYLVQRELEMTESIVVPCGDTLGDIAERACSTALDLKKKSVFFR